MQEAKKSCVLSVADGRGERCELTSAGWMDVPLSWLVRPRREVAIVGAAPLSAVGKPKCMPWRDSDSFSGENHPGQRVDFFGELLVKVACKWHLNPRDCVDPSGFGFRSGHDAGTVRQPPWVTVLVQEMMSH